MKIKIENPVNLVLLVLVAVVVVIMIADNRKNNKTVEMKIDTLSAEIQQMNNLTESVVAKPERRESLDWKQLEDLLQKAGTISTAEKQKIRDALNDIRNTRQSVEQERRKALQLIKDLNATSHEQN